MPSGQSDGSTKWVIRITEPDHYNILVDSEDQGYKKRRANWKDVHYECEHPRENMFLFRTRIERHFFRYILSLAKGLERILSLRKKN